MKLRNKAASVMGTLICLIGLLGLCGCGDRKALAVDGFNEIMTQKGFVISDGMKVVSIDYVEAVSLAVADDYQIEFYVVSDKDTAISLFEQNRSLFEEKEEKGAMYVTKDIGNYSFFSQQSGGMYRMVARIDNTMLYVVADEAHKSEIAALTKELGY